MPTPAHRLLRNARREAVLVATVWALALAWTVGYSWLFGYAHAADEWPVRLGLVAPDSPAVTPVFGVPSWVAFGVLAPWLVCSTLTAIYGLFLMPDDDLGADAGEGGHP